MPESDFESGPRRIDLEDQILSIQPGDAGRFGVIEAEVRAYQRRYNPVVAAYGDTSPYLPIEAFRLAGVRCFPENETERIFRSSGTGTGRRAKHSIRSLGFYNRVCEHGFDDALGGNDFSIAAIVPAYGEDSSLVAMLNHLVSRSESPSSQIVEASPDALQNWAANAVTQPWPLVVFGAAFALLGLAESGMVRLPGERTTIVETGGMKTFRRSISRTDLHRELSDGFGIPRSRIWSEYGMCELSSQAYASGDVWFSAPPWMRVRVVDPSDPGRTVPDGTDGVLALIDLANLYSASGLLTEDRGVADGGRFQVLGRAAGADLRGCNFLFENRS